MATMQEFPNTNPRNCTFTAKIDVTVPLADAGKVIQDACRLARLCTLGGIIMASPNIGDMPKLTIGFDGLRVVIDLVSIPDSLFYYAMRPTVSAEEIMATWNIVIKQES